MPGEFYIEGKQARVDLSQIIARLNDLSVKIDNLQTLGRKSRGSASGQRFGDGGLANSGSRCRQRGGG